MTYPAAPPAPATPPPPAAPPRRPVTVRLAAVLLVVMAVGGLGYSVATLVVTPGVVDRFRDAADRGGTDGYVTGLWLMATVGTVLSVILFALYVVLAAGLLRGSQGFRVATWVVCGLGALFGCGSAITVLTQRAGEGTPGTLGYALSESYPDGWIATNIALALAQLVGYLVVAVLLVPDRGFFRPARAPEAERQPTYVALPTYGAQQPYPYPGPQPPPTTGSDDPSLWARPAQDDGGPPPGDGGVRSTE